MHRIKGDFFLHQLSVYLIEVLVELHLDHIIERRDSVYIPHKIIDGSGEDNEERDPKSSVSHDAVDESLIRNKVAHS